MFWRCSWHSLAVSQRLSRATSGSAWGAGLAQAVPCCNVACGSVLCPSPL